MSRSTFSASTWLVLFLVASVHGRTVRADECPAAGDCLTVHPTPGCNDAACCSSTCAVDPTCCSIAWDSDCVTNANAFCSICGASGLGSCFLIQTNPKCDDAECCNIVCQLDPFCCSLRWDNTCVFYATALCDPGRPADCGDPLSGSCFVAHPAPACDDATCCEVVCAKDPSCCSQSWDAICVAFAAAACSSTCDAPCPAGSTLEGEVCGSHNNDVCLDPVPGSAAVTLVGSSGCGFLTFNPSAGLSRVDTDVWSVTVPDTDGDGIARVTLGLTSEPGTFAALVPAGTCGVPQSPLHVQAVSCSESVGQHCIPPGTWWIVCTTGTFPQRQAPQSVLCPGRSYTLRVEIDQNCGDPCRSTDPCLTPHDNPGCEDPECCAATCASDAFCCELEWDLACVSTAVTACGYAPPANDACSGAQALVPGEVLVVETGSATPDGAPFPNGCIPGNPTPGNDVWCKVGPLAQPGSVVISTCSPATLFDTVLIGYRGRCESLEAIACSDTAVCSVQGKAELTLDIACDEVLLVRVLGRQGNLGRASVLLSVPGAPPCPGACPADLDGNGAVDGADLGLLLSGWGIDATGDINADGTIDGADLGVLLSAWGPCR